MAETVKQSAVINKITVAAVLASRVLTGGLFIFSGFVKAVDLWGFIFKIEEYFALVDFTAPRSVSLSLALIIASFEFVSGVLLLTGAYRRSIVVLMTLLMAGFDILTFYLWIADPIPDCGCFGDAWVLSNGATFFKNIVLTTMLVYLLINNKKIKLSLFKPAVQWIPTVLSVLYIATIGLVCYNVQPQIDFRPYPVGRELALTHNDDDEIEDVMYIYTDGTTQKTFPADSLPGDGWEFVDIADTNGAGRAQNDIFSIYNGDEDVSEEIFDNANRRFLLVIPELNRADISFSYFINSLYRLCRKNDIEFTALVATSDSGLERWRDLSLAEYDCFTAEDTSLKELARGNMSLVYLENGIIKWKSTVSSVYDTDIEKLEETTGADFAMKMAPQPVTIKQLTWWYIALLAVLAVIQWSIILIFVPKKESKN